MIHVEVHRAGMLVGIVRTRFQDARKAGSKPSAYFLPDMAKPKVEMNSGYPQDAERR